MEEELEESVRLYISLATHNTYGVSYKVLWLGLRHVYYLGTVPNIYGCHLILTS